MNEKEDSNVNKHDELTNSTTAETSTVATAAAGLNHQADGNDDYTMAQCMQCMEHLTSIFQFTPQQAQNAINVVGADVTVCYNYILDHESTALDKGGAIYPKYDCPHISQCIHHDHELNQYYNYNCFDEHNNEDNNNNNNRCTYIQDEQHQQHDCGSKRKSEIIDGLFCPKGENWICLTCNAIRCSRYVNGHCKDHWKNTKRQQEEEEDKKVGDTACITARTDRIGHCIALSLQDLSVWCYECNAYIIHPDLTKIVNKFEHAKFANDGDDGDDGDDDDDDGDDKNNCQDDDKNETNDNDNNMEYVDDNEPESKLESNEEEDIDDGDYDGEEAEGSGGHRHKKNSLSHGDDDEDDEEEEDPHPHLPKSISDLAKFIKSDDCQNIIILAGAGMSRASGSKYLVVELYMYLESLKKLVQ